VQRCRLRDQPCYPWYVLITCQVFYMHSHTCQTITRPRLQSLALSYLSLVSLAPRTCVSNGMLPVLYSI